MSDQYKAEIDIYESDLEVDVYCKCGAHFVSYKDAGVDNCFVECPRCRTTYKLQNKLSILNQKVSDGIILKNDNNEFPDWRTP